RRDGGELALGSPQQRNLLLSLLPRADHPVSTGRLVDDLWGAEPPARATAVVRTYAHRPRRALGSAAPASVGGGLPAHRGPRRAEHPPPRATRRRGEGAPRRRHAPLGVCRPVR
ncbi:winged helix-turn-helix domain-containing protein, partial [Streptomyces sp. FH025]|uniref:AfsR/SARP family transcriptional regulator n=1 Tax=Streptomyces sp. FH025 TaxID=2815937 RepID=UPI001A9D88F4|nr:winged helix-turn-helix domain-containing protein [Streptomyces sp. FH025]